MPKERDRVREPCPKKITTMPKDIHKSKTEMNSICQAEIEGLLFKVELMI